MKLKSFTLETFALPPIPAEEAALRGLRHLARKVFIDRNAAGMIAHRASIKASARPHLRRAIKNIRKARDALCAGDTASYQRHRDAAILNHRDAELQFRQPFMTTAAKPLANLNSSKGAEEAAAAKNEKHADLDYAIRGFLERDEPLDVQSLKKLSPGVSRSTIYNRRAIVLADMPKGRKPK